MMTIDMQFYQTDKHIINIQRIRYSYASTKTKYSHIWWGRVMEQRKARLSAQ